MLSPEDLKAIMMAADADPNKVGEALHCMLDAEVYLYVHLDSTSEEAGLFQFHHPKNGKLMIPFFSDEQKARENSRDKVKVLPYPCRFFFEQTFGSTLLLDPRERNCMLFPNEVAALLVGAYQSGPLPAAPSDFAWVGMAN